MLAKDSSLSETRKDDLGRHPARRGAGMIEIREEEFISELTSTGGWYMDVDHFDGQGIAEAFYALMMGWA
jgi:hypothetical protein